MLEKERQEDEALDSFDVSFKWDIKIFKSHLDSCESWGEIKNYLSLESAVRRISVAGIIRTDKVSQTYAGIFDRRGYYIDVRRKMVISNGSRKPKLDIAYYLDGGDSSEFVYLFKAFRNTQPRRVSLRIAKKHLQYLKEEQKLVVQQAEDVEKSIPKRVPNRF